MRTYQHNGDTWYADVTPLWMRVLRWVVWLGGWETVVHDRHGYRVQLRPEPWRPGVDGWRGLYESVTPIALFGHRCVFQRYGCRFRTRRGYLCVSWPARGMPHWCVYWSRDSTPGSATYWLAGAPSEIVRAATQTGRMAEECARRHIRSA